MYRPNRLTWLNRFERNIVEIIPKIGLKNNQGVIIQGFYDATFPTRHRFDYMGNYIYVAAKDKDNDYRYIMKEIGIAVPLFIGNIVEFNGDLITKKIGDLYWDTVHLCKWWALKRRIQHFIYISRFIHRWRKRRYWKKRGL